MARLLSPQARRALITLNAMPQDASEEFLTLPGFKREMLAELVLAGLVTAVTETVQTSASPIKVERYRVTNEGLKALKE